MESVKELVIIIWYENKQIILFHLSYFLREVVHFINTFVMKGILKWSIIVALSGQLLGLGDEDLLFWVC